MARHSVVGVRSTTTVSSVGETWWGGIGAVRASELLLHAALALARGLGAWRQGGRLRFTKEMGMHVVHREGG
jgi:hypothetical protein